MNLDFSRFASCILLSSRMNMIENLQLKKFNTLNSVKSINKFGLVGAQSMVDKGNGSTSFSKNLVLDKMNSL